MLPRTVRAAHHLLLQEHLTARPHPEMVDGTRPIVAMFLQRTDENLREVVGEFMAYWIIMVIM